MSSVWQAANLSMNPDFGISLALSHSVLLIKQSSADPHV